MEEGRPSTSHKHKRARIGPKDPPPKLDPFPHPFQRGEYASGDQPRTRVELKLMRVSQFIRRKDRWWKKRLNTKIKENWKRDLSKHCTNEEIEYVFAELEYYDRLREGNMQVAVDGVWRAHDWIPQEITASLKAGVAKLEDVPDLAKDWHPGSNQQVLDLVHPSLFCYVQGVSRKTEEEARPYSNFMGGGDPAEGDLMPIVKAISHHGWDHKVGEDYATSKKYQWLPSEFRVDEEGHVIIRSYINNLHPIHSRQLYPVIAQIFERFIPLFNKVLTDLLNPMPLRINDFNYYPDEPKRKNYPKIDDYYEAHENWWENRQPVQPTPPPYELRIPPWEKKKTENGGDGGGDGDNDGDDGNGDKKEPVVVDLRGRDLQVIAKIAEILLTPDNPEYPGGVWHVEGMENEHIVASGIYYFDVDNITDSRLGFRQAVREPDYEQNDSIAPPEIYGLPDEGPLNQHVGDVITFEGLCLAFPNTFQHKVAPFKLSDPSRPGHRKILVFFLVDPAIRVLSTSHVPPQQRSWLVEPLSDILWKAGKIPPEITNHIVSFLDWPMGLEEAKEHREVLMKERKYFIDNNTEEYFARPFSLCEH